MANIFQKFVFNTLTKTNIHSGTGYISVRTTIQQGIPDKIKSILFILFM